MGGAAPVESGKKGKKSLDAELNLVPFIDLLSCLISFLLITAVWTQTSALKVSSTGGLAAEEQPQKDQKNAEIRLLMTERGYKLSIGDASTDIVKTAANPAAFDTKVLVEKLKAACQLIPNGGTDVKTNTCLFNDDQLITVSPEDAINYEDLILTVDAIQSEVGIKSVSVAQATN